MDPKLIELLENAAENVASGKCYGLAVIQVIKERDGNWGVECSYQGPQLNLMAGVTRLAHGLNVGLDQFVPAVDPPKDVSS